MIPEDKSFNPWYTHYKSKLAGRQGGKVGNTVKESCEPVTLILKPYLNVPPPHPRAVATSESGREFDTWCKHYMAKEQNVDL